MLFLVRKTAQSFSFYVSVNRSISVYMCVRLIITLNDRTLYAFVKKAERGGET